MTDPNQYLDAYLDGQLTAEQLAEIEAALCRDPGFAEDFASAMLIDSCLREKFQWQELVAALHLDDEPAQEKDPGSLSAHDFAAAGSYVLRLTLTSGPAKKFYTYAGVAAVLLLAFVLFNPWANNDDSNDAPYAGNPADETNDPSEPGRVGPVLSTPVATLTATHNAQWAEGASAPGSDLRTGTKLHPNQRLTLTAGFAEITTNDGAVAILEAPATIELIDNDNALRLHTGKLVGSCYSESSKGFVVKTDHADITDIGTEFGVQVKAGNVTATVITGEIEINVPGSAPKRLTQDQTAQLRVTGVNRKLQIKDQLAQGFEQLLPRRRLADALRNDPAMIAYWGFEADDIVDGKLLNRAVATQGKMNGTLGQPGKPDSSPTLTDGRLPGTSALRFEAQELDLVRISQEDAKAIDGLEQFTIGLWVRPDHMDQESHHLVTKRTVDGNVRDILNFGLAWDGAGGGYQRNSAFIHSQHVGPGFTPSFKADTLVRDARWLHLVVTYDRGERCLYIDGRLIERLPRQNTDRLAASDAELLLGASMVELNEPGTYLDGDLDELFILGRSMSADEVQALYGSGVAAE